MFYTHKFYPKKSYLKIVHPGFSSADKMRSHLTARQPLGQLAFRKMQDQQTSESQIINATFGRAPIWLEHQTRIPSPFGEGRVAKLLAKPAEGKFDQSLDCIGNNALIFCNLPLLGEGKQPKMINTLIEDFSDFPYPPIKPIGILF